MVEEVHVHKNGGSGNAAWAVTLVLILLLAVGIWYFLIRGGETREMMDMDITVPGEMTTTSNM